MKAVVLLLLFLVAGGSAAFWFAGAWPDRADNPLEAATTASVAQSEDRIRALGYVEPTSEMRRLAFKTDTVIESCAVEVGQRVKKGQLLMTMKNQDERAVLAVAEQELAVAVAERNLLLAGAHPDEITAAEHLVELQKEHVRHTEKRFERYRQLSDKNAVSAEDRDQTETDLIRAKRSLQQAEAQLLHLKCLVRTEDKLVADAKVQRASAHIQSAKERINNTILIAPFDGTVLEILRREGEAPRQMDREPVIVFADDSRLRIRAEIDERFVAYLQRGQQATIHGRGLGGKKYLGEIVLVKKVMGPKTVFSRDAAERKDLDTLQVLIEMPNDFVSPIGLQVDVEISVQDLAQASR